MQKKKVWWKIPLIILLIIITALISILGGYVLYISLQYYRIADNTLVDISNNNGNMVKLNTNYKISTYNIGFGAYSHNFSFFMDYGETLDGKKLQGKGSIAKDKDTVIYNTTGAINTIKNLDVDFAFFQEVDIKATRSYKFNQYNFIQNSFSDYSSSIAINFHSAFLFYPIFSPHGKTDAGIATISKYKINSATRRSLPIDNSFPTKFFDLDRCIEVNRLPIENSQKELILINVHLSAYDEGGIIRKLQLDMLNQIFKEEKDKGNYVIAGGDFNHDIASSLNLWQTNRKQPDWVYVLNDSSLEEGYRFVSSQNAPTCRSTDGPYVKNESYTVVLDGFICSQNVSEINISNIDTDFLYSDHNPSVFEFILN